MFVALVVPQPATAGTYNVVACDAHSATPGVSANNSWALSASAGHTAESLCPSRGSEFYGITTRIAGPVGVGVFERASFTAPPGTTISGLRWAGRYARGNCDWATEMRARPSENVLIGARAGQRCSSQGMGFPSPLEVAIPPGTTQLLQNTQCGAGTCRETGTFHTYYASVTVSDPQPPSIRVTGGGLASGRWVHGLQQMSFDAEDNTGIGRAELRVAAGSPSSSTFSCDYTRPTPCVSRKANLDYDTRNLPDGRHNLRLTVFDAGGEPAGIDQPILTDNTPPAPVEVAVVDGEGWRRSNGFTVRWTNAPQEHAPIVRARYRLCGPGGSCVDGSHAGPDVQELAGLPVERLGDNALRVWLEDEAGNQTSALASNAVHLRLDPEPPQLAFQEQDPADPLTVTVRANDAHSGVASGEIEMRRRRARTWHSLDTRVDGERLVATVNDERFRRGTFEFRARAADHAGNEASTGKRGDGGEAAIRLPVRVTTRLRAGFRKVKVKRRVVRRKGRRRVVRRRVRVLKPAGRLRYRRRARLGGVLRNPDGQPIDGASITVLSRPDVEGRGFTTAGIVRTNRRGRFTYAVRGTKSRVLRFRFDGSRRIRGATRDVTVRVPAASTIKADPPKLLNGQATTFKGRVRTGPMPQDGKLIEVQAFFRGRWRTISTTRSDAAGRWSFVYRFGATTGIVRYRFRVRLPREGGYPFDTGRSRPVTVVVRGL